MLETLISSKTRLKLLLKFFLNSDTRAYLRGLESEFKESATAIRTELNSLEKAGMLVSETQGNRKYFRANVTHPLYDDIHRIVMKQVGLDQIIQNITDRLGLLERVYLVGSFAHGLDSPIIDIVLVGAVNKAYLVSVLDKLERVVHRKIRYLTFDDYPSFEKTTTALGSITLLWQADSPDQLLQNKNH